MTAVKICGIRTSADLETCRQADYLGFVVLSDSPRNLELSTAQDLMSCCGNLRVAVTTERRPRELEKMVMDLEPDVLQLHSPLDRKLLSSLSGMGVHLWGMLPATKDVSLDAGCVSECQALVLDTPSERFGGSGKVHDWDLSRRINDMISPLPLVLAGGLRPDNVHEAITKVVPFAVDVSSGVEEDGKKDRQKVDGFITNVKRVDGS